MTKVCETFLAPRRSCAPRTHVLFVVFMIPGRQAPERGAGEAAPEERQGDRAASEAREAAEGQGGDHGHQGDGPRSGMSQLRLSGFGGRARVPGGDDF